MQQYLVQELPAADVFSKKSSDLGRQVNHFDVGAVADTKLIARETSDRANHPSTKIPTNPEIKKTTLGKAECPRKFVDHQDRKKRSEIEEFERGTSD